MPKDRSTEFSKSPFVVVNRLGTELSQMNKGIWRTNEKKKKKKGANKQKNEKTRKQRLKSEGQILFCVDTINISACLILGLFNNRLACRIFGPL